MYQGWPTIPASGAALLEAKIDKSNALNAEIHYRRILLGFD
jgi:hypothetical protein